MKIIGIIPARMGSSRFPGKPLKKILGKTMIEHVYRRSVMNKILGGLYVATCDEEIKEEVERFGGRVVMTASTHETCSDRVAEAYDNIKSDAEIVVIIQGDEPLVYPEMIDLALKPMLKDRNKEIFCTNLVQKIKTLEEFNDPNEIKVVFDLSGYALYFSREPIPSLKKSEHLNWYKQVCIMPFWQETLKEFNKMERTPLEEAESIDMMRIIEHGYRVKIVESPFSTYSVDTEKDLRKVQEIMREDKLYKKYCDKLG